MTQLQGKVDILGAGPGSPEFLTLVGHQILAQAEVLIYDALIDDRLLTIPPGNCDRILMGKRGGSASVSQSTINQQLIQSCQQGKKVVRLKTGDPFIFGRTRSEVEALTRAGCPVTVWPGISSALAAPLMAGIPLTDAALSQSVAVLSGHEVEPLNWNAIAQLDTVVILMGTRTLAEIAQRLILGGKSPKTPVAVIRWGGWPQQETWFGDLDSIAAQHHVRSPAVIVVGDVVSLSTSLAVGAPINHQPLAAKTVMVTRATGQVSQFRDRLQALGAHVIECPALEIVPPSSYQDLDHAIAQLQTFQWLILTSANAVHYFFGRLRHHHRDSRALANLKIAVVGRKTAHELQQYGLTPDYIPPNFVADSLVAHFPASSLTQTKILFPRVESGGRDVLVRELQTQGALVTEVAAYQSQCPAEMAAHIITAFQEKEIDVVTFASSKTVRHFKQLLEQSLDQINLGRTEAVHSISQLMDTTCIASIGPLTTKSCLEHFGRASLEAAEYTLDGLADAIVQYFQDPDDQISAGQEIKPRSNISA